MSEEAPVLGWNEDQDFVKRVLGQSGVPAFVVRAARVEDALHVLVQSCRKQRDQWLGMVRVRLGKLVALAGDWEALRPLLADDAQMEGLRCLHQELQPRLRVPVQPTTSPGVLRRALRELCESMTFFNNRWRKYLAQVDVSQVNLLREGFNKYYLLEKECWIGSPLLARKGFHKLEPLTPEELHSMMPPLTVPRLKS
jgi:hypothetical protein